jgi:hypothetical protein
MIWNYFDKLYILTTPNSDRVIVFENQLKTLGIPYELRINTPAQKIKNDSGKVVGLGDIMKHDYCDETCQNIRNNHLYIIKEANAQNLRRIIICEDDCIFDLEKIVYINRAIDWLRNEEWDMFFLGYVPWPLILSYPVSRNVVKVTTPLAAHCYAVSNVGMKKILNDPLNKENLHVDKLYAQMSVSKYALFPSIAFQNVEPSLYTGAIEKIGFGPSFSKLSKTFEVLALIMPYTLITIIAIFFRNRKLFVPVLVMWVIVIIYILYAYN